MTLSNRNEGAACSCHLNRLLPPAAIKKFYKRLYSSEPSFQCPASSTRFRTGSRKTWHYMHLLISDLPNSTSVCILHKLLVTEVSCKHPAIYRRSHSRGSHSCFVPAMSRVRTLDRRSTKLTSSCFIDCSNHMLEKCLTSMPQARGSFCELNTLES
jgi:hypothetical protein